MPTCASWRRAPPAFFASQGIKPGDRVMLLSQNAPEWGMTYFGVLKAGATCIPVDPESSTDELTKLCAGRRCGRRSCVSAKLAADHPELTGAVGGGRARGETLDIRRRLRDAGRSNRR